MGDTRAFDALLRLTRWLPRDQVDRGGRGRVVLVELGVVEQRYRAVLEVLEGATVTEVAKRNGVARQTVHDWLRRYGGQGGLSALADRSSRPDTCPHQMPVAVEAKVVALRRAHPGWGPATIRTALERDGVEPVPSRSGVYRALVRHNLVEGKKRKRRREDYRRWERGRAMELWQMDVMGRAFLTDGRECKVVTGIDDHSRFVVCAAVVERATAGPVCAALQGALARQGVPKQILTDNGKVFTARFGAGPGPVRFDRICTENGIKHLLSAPYSPTTTGRVERLHKTIRAEFLAEHDRRHDTVAALQGALDAWVEQYNTIRPHQSCGGRAPVERFCLAGKAIAAVESAAAVEAGQPAGPVRRPGGVSRWVNTSGRVSLAGFDYAVGATFAGEPVEAVARGGLVEVFHAGVLIATHVQRLKPDQANCGIARVPQVRRARDATTGLVVTRLADGSGNVSFAGTAYGCGRAWARGQVEVSIVAGSVQLAAGGKVIRVHSIRHDRSRELGAFANPKGRPRRNPPGTDDHVVQVPDLPCRAGTGT